MKSYNRAMQGGILTIVLLMVAAIATKNCQSEEQRIEEESYEKPRSVTEMMVGRQAKLIE